jgi:hypothetical protein
MENAINVGVVLAGLFFSLACALLLEELIFGGLFRFFFAPSPLKPKPGLNGAPIPGRSHES